VPEKPTTSAGYAPNQVARVKSTCLYLGTKLGDLMDELVVVCGLVPWRRVITYIDLTLKKMALCTLW